MVETPEAPQGSNILHFAGRQITTLTVSDHALSSVHSGKAGQTEVDHLPLLSGRILSPARGGRSSKPNDSRAKGEVGRRERYREREKERRH